MSAGNAKIGQPAPQFKATAVVNGEFKEVQLSDYRGKMKPNGGKTGAHVEPVENDCQRLA